LLKTIENPLIIQGFLLLPYVMELELKGNWAKFRIWVANTKEEIAEKIIKSYTNEGFWNQASGFSK